MVRRLQRARPGRGGGTRRSQPRRGHDDNEIPEAYLEMLVEAESRDSTSLETDRPIKRRKVGERVRPAALTAPLLDDTPTTNAQIVSLPDESGSDDETRQVQTAYDSTASEEDSDEEEMDWEEVDIQQAPIPVAASSDEYFQPAGSGRTGDESLQITLEKPSTARKAAVPRRRPLSAAEKKLRLEIHKVHLLCLLSHVNRRNIWCNDEEVQGFLKQMLPKQIISLLNPPENRPQPSRSAVFIDGLNQAADVFSKRFRKTMPGLKRPHWQDEPEAVQDRAKSIMSDAEVFLSRDDFRKQAKSLRGSRDFGAQLFCALLRSVAVEARLVCSLQPLTFSGAIKNTTTPKKQRSSYIVISSDESHETSSSEKQSPLPTRRLGRPQFTSKRPLQASSRLDRPPRLSESSYPVFWVEAFNEVVQKWIPIDPLVTMSLAKPSKFEPPASDPHNQMSYVVAFEDDGSARDVTRRYAKAFNAKTRKLRVESTRNGEMWWTRTLRAFEKPFLEDRDEIEVSELTARTAAEPMPRNVQDFKDHPVYALDRHLRRNQVVHPKRVIGQVSLGKSGMKNEVLEPVYRRSDVHNLRSADGWYRLGRDIKLGEQALKRVRPSRNRVAETTDGEGGDDPVEMTPLYASFQTEVYQPPPVIKGRIPKNGYGNLDVYVPSMVPPGGVHVKHLEARQAARILGIDYADAVTGFNFKGRHGTAVFEGVVIAAEYLEAVQEVLRGLEHERVHAELELRSAAALQMWKHLLLRLRIAERVKGYAVEGEDEENISDAVDEAGAEEDADEDVEVAGGGFLLESHIEEASGGGFLPEPLDRDSGGVLSSGLVHETQSSRHSHPPDEDEDDFGGGFIPEDESVQSASIIQPLPPIPPQSTLRREQADNQPRYSLVVVPNEQPNHSSGSELHHAKPSTPSVESPDPGPQVDPPTRDTVDGSSEVPIVVSSSVGGDSKSVSLEVVSRSPPGMHSPVDDVEEPGSQVDEVSLLSEDPDDEDAIPEWLMSD
ncbi:hypothetical protein ASPZODRAFT_139503 [Penicilliopsis zonata CBS 506.65]|uniref:Rad4 beta-hairpin domain-containing protein n=1 Tax=Penicilliopsis zonata CBS 506.65 TaxID=1073090 RepID=A0A1L9SSK2_9EURO|nr:hypothetical protein ASPZODRAFT_139503 [Penicilliopsis zonata CBS 506.65]OJJ50185.1 hypothetical protein ASPZODRAFT_139503 [Penicilliopsis zonata CBS 506.65]